MEKKKALKNPLSVAFGNLLKNEITQRGLSLEDIERNSAIAVGYLKLLMQGQVSLHISKATNIYQIFSNDYYHKKFSLEGIINLLSIITILEAEGNEYKRLYEEKLKKLNKNLYSKEKLNKEYLFGIKKASEHLSASNPKYAKLLFPFFELNLFDITDSDNSTKLITQNSLYLDIEKFLVEFDNIIIKEDALYIEPIYSHFFNDIPSIYTEIFISTKENLTYLPHIINIEELWKWEQKAGKNIESLFAIMTGSVDVTTVENLTNYSYPYLWFENFREVSFLYANSKKNNADKLQYEFKKNLETVYNLKKDKKNKTGLKDWEDGFKKVKFYNTNNVNADIKRILTLENITYDIFWIFKLTNGIHVAFLAKEDRITENKLNEGKVLKVSEIQERLKVIEKLKTNVLK